MDEQTAAGILWDGFLLGQDWADEHPHKDPAVENSELEMSELPTPAGFVFISPDGERFLVTVQKLA